jgi:hypothetical protein
MAGNVASDLEDHSAAGRLDEARPLVEKLETMCTELTRLVADLPIDELQRMAGWNNDGTRLARGTSDASLRRDPGRRA